ncbi:MAG: glutathionylspermidine synthase family protein [Methylobacteriaceae bacterium]|nr:glutathionylspermidine synthase family protein [Methylobacteriaceae bacterium]
MRRLAVAPRANFEARARELGFAFHTIDGEAYWNESACYAFTLRQIEDDLEAPSAELHQMAMELVGRAARDEALLTRLRIPRQAWPLVADSFARGDASLYGRFDLSYDGKSPAKLLEYNADTPTSLYESAVFQWVWLEDAMKQGLIPQGADQFNSLHEKLVARLGEIASGGLFHIAGLRDNEEDKGFVAYLEDCARQAGIETSVIGMSDIGVSAENKFCDPKDRWIELMFKLYPWEWMMADEFGASPAMANTTFIEPAWKMILSNKGALALLWQMAPGHPNLLETYFEDDPRKSALGGRFARKPLLSREGANVMLVDGEHVAREEGPYGAEGFVRQALAPLPDFDGWRPVVGSWIVGDEAAGIGLREDRDPITSNTSRFTPHAILD